MGKLVLNRGLVEKLYLVDGWSTGRIADEYGYKKNSVLVHLRNHNLLRKSPGRDVEDKVIAWLRNQKKNVIKMRGDARFDCISNGEKIEIKSAHCSGNGTRFEVRHDCCTDRTDFSSLFDSFYLVFLSIISVPIYRLSAGEVGNIKELTIHRIESTKYPLQLVGYLES